MKHQVMQAQDGLTEANMAPQIRDRQANRIGNRDTDKYESGGIAKQRHRRGRVRDRLGHGLLRQRCVVVSHQATAK